MADAPRTRRSLGELLGDPDVVRWTTRYLKRLLIERPAIRARLENPGGSVILMGADNIEHRGEYSPVIGNDIHLDLLEAEQAVASLPATDQQALLRWTGSLTPAQEAEYLEARGRVVKPASDRRQAERKAHSVVETLNDREES